MADETGGEQIGTARIDVSVNTATMQAGLNAARSKMSSLGEQAEAEFNKANASTKRYAESLLKQANTLGMTRAQQVAYNAELRVGGELGKQIAATALAREASLKRETTAIAGAAAGYTSGAKSAREIAFAMRTLPAQFTDIATAIGSGQRPLTILLQQGGQIKDMFGGVRPALQAVGSQLLKLINPYTAVAVAAGALLVAWKQGVDEIEAYNAALINTGNYAGLTAKQLDDMAASMDSVRGTQHAAAAALAQAVQAGAANAEQARAMGEALEVAGRDADKMVQAFAKIAGDPVNALVELNKQQHFLTDATYEQIKALQDQGHEQEAATLAIKTYADTVVKRADDIKGSLDNVSQAWGGVKSAAAEAWDAMIHGTRNTANDAIQGIKDWWSGLRGLADYIRNPMAATLQPGYANAAATPDPNRDAAKKSAEQQANETLIAFQQQTGKFKTAEEKRVADIVQIIGQANSAIDKANAAGDKALATKIARQEEALIAAIQNQGKDGPSKSAPRQRDNSDKLRQMGVDDILKQIDAQGKLNDAKQRAAATDAAYAAQLQTQLSTRKQQIDLQIMSIGMGRQEYERQSELVEVYGRFDRQLAQLNQERDRGSISTDQYNRRLQDLKKTEADTVDAVVSGFHKLDAARSDWRNGFIGALVDFHDQAADVAGQTHDLFTNAFNGMADAVGNFVQTGKANLADLARSFLADLARMEARILESKVLESILGAISTGPSGANMGYFGAYSQSATDSTAGSIVSSIYGNAKGGVYDSSSLSRYSGGVYDSPQFFKFASGGVFGEAGPEAIMPLSRGADGKLGVKSQGGGNVYVSVEVKGGDGNAKVSQQESTDGQGNKLIKLIIDQAVGEVDKRIGRDGSTGQIIKQTFGLSRRGVPVAG